METKTTTTVKNFLSENRNDVISFYNEKIANFYTISLSAFMTDVLVNFKKVTTGVDLKKFDLFANLTNAQQRLGLFNATTVVADDKATAKLRNQYKGTAYMAMV